METDLNSQDRKDLDKFIKFFALKTVQVIVQARLGEKICTRSSSSPTGSDWFNLAIKDIPEVTHEAKKALSGQLPAVGRSMCVEISLKTSEGDSMELEIWLGWEGILTNTAMCLLHYRQFERTPPIMGIIIDHFVDRPYPSSSPMHPCSYRTGEDAGVTYPSVEDSQEVCTTSFSTSPPSQLSSSRLSCQPAGLGLGSADLAYPVVFTAGLNATHPHQLMVPGKEGGTPLAPNQPAHGAQADQERLATHTPSDGTHCAVTPSSSEDTETVSNSSEGRASPHDVLETIFVRKVGAFVNKPVNQVTVLQLPPVWMSVNPPDSPETTSPLHGSLHSDGSSGGSSGNTHDDFVMIDFKPAFSKDDILPMDLGTFYREFQNPPQLSSLSIDIGAQSMAEDLDSLPEKLAVHEKNVREFDAFVETLQ
uniref:Autophagy related 13 n=1 Tax=Nannospalax galili TaxID=1026970 RepID=A0A8C6R8D6_NANGA